MLTKSKERMNLKKSEKSEKRSPRKNLRPRLRSEK